ncbi:uncharacterized protein [Temnothorax longispinosus]|uniref:Uncharacterized protein n=1 Tax=Temnothorax longispinosus TaxID=300112 RepID=A0A4S2KTN3_9HYME|nr:Uncharacterized protein DBV15_01437 [Temnothorax longispinosus]
MDADEFNRNFGGCIDRHATASGEIGAMNIDSVDFDSELRQIEREINRYKPTLQSCRDECENIETEICDVRQLQRKAQFVMDNVRWEEENIHERFKDINLNYDACVERSSSHEDPNETISAGISELTTQRREMLKELGRLRRQANDNGKKLTRVRAMIAEQEEKNAMQIRELKEISESGLFISPDVRKRINAILTHQEINEVDSAIN